MITQNLNVGFIDRLVRGLIAIDLLALWLADFLTGPSVIIALLIAIYAAITGVLGTCFVYSLTGLNTRQRTEP